MNPRRRGIGLAKAFEDPFQMLWSDAGAIVGNVDCHMGVEAQSGYADATSLFGKLHRITQQVPNNLLEAVLVSHDSTFNAGE
jgi:hypothetical protein